MYTQEQLNESSKAKEGAFWAIPSSIVQPTGDHWEFGWGSLMHIRDVMTGDMTKPFLRYDHFRAYSQNLALGQDYTRGDFVYMAYYDVILAANTSIKGYVAKRSQPQRWRKGTLECCLCFPRTLLSRTRFDV